jgi:uncharacterized damage-inducible protein DinB
MPIADALLMEIDQEGKTTQRLLERIPEDKLSWKPHAKSYSLGQLSLHIAAGTGNLAKAAALDSFELPNFQQGEAKSRKELLDTFSQSLATAKQTIASMDDARMMGLWTMTRNGQPVMSIPRAAFIRSIMLNHVYHHRGQLSVYLRLLDVPVPSIYGPSADENPFA